APQTDPAARGLRALPGVCMPVIARLSLDSVVKLATFLLVAITSVLLARLTWTLIEPTSVLPPAASVPLAELQAGSSTGARGGFADAAAAAVSAALAGGNRVVNAPEAPLSWTLKGLFPNPDPSGSAASLAPLRQPQKLYRVRASQPRSVTLQEVF